MQLETQEVRDAEKMRVREDQARIWGQGFDERQERGVGGGEGGWPFCFYEGICMYPYFDYLGPAAPYSVYVGELVPRKRKNNSIVTSLSHKVKYKILILLIKTHNK